MNEVLGILRYAARRSLKNSTAQTID